VLAQNKDGQTPLHLVTLEDYDRYLDTPIVQEIVRMLIERGANVSAQDKDGRTPLHLASQAGQLEIAQMLIERGADVSAQDKDGRAPMHLVFMAFGLILAFFIFYFSFRTYFGLL
jgi:ankyrin repeat protein